MYVIIHTVIALKTCELTVSIIQFLQQKFCYSTHTETSKLKCASRAHYLTVLSGSKSKTFFNFVFKVQTILRFKPWPHLQPARK